MWEGAREVQTQSQAEAAVRQDKAAGYIAIKVYSRLAPEAYRWVVSAARAQGLPVVGHIPDAVGLREVAAARQDSIEHLDAFFDALQPDPGPAPDASWREVLERADMNKLAALVDAIHAGGNWVCPTIVLDEPFPTNAEWQSRRTLIPPATLERYRTMYAHWHDDAGITKQLYETEIAITRDLHRAGVPLLLGTDAMKLTVLPGFSLHQELENFVAAGLTPYEAIRTGTVDAARFLHQAGEFGTVASGLRADLLLLESNPLQDVRNVSKRVGVMVNGRWLSEAELQRRLMELRNHT